MNGPKALLATGDGYTDLQFKRLRDSGFDVMHRAKVSRGELFEILPNLHAYLLGGDEHLDAELLEVATKLRIISFVGTGYGAFIDVASAAAHGISIRNTPEIMADAVAEHTIGLLIGLVRRLFAHNESVKRSGEPVVASRELRELTVGIMGMGAIGSRVARLLVHAFGCQVAYFNRTRKPPLEVELGLTYCTLPELMTVADAIIVLLPTSPDTANILNRDCLEKAKAGIYVVNTAGASLVDATALKAALLSGQVQAAAFDGYWIEPPPSVGDDPFGFLGLPDRMFVVTPHTAAKTTSAWRRMVEQAVANVVGSTTVTESKL